MKPPDQPDLDWYTAISQRKGLQSPRCPYATAKRCPRYYESVWQLGQKGVSTEIDPEEDKRLEEHWKKTGPRPSVREEATALDTSVRQDGSKHHHFYRFCPDVLFNVFGWFADQLAEYSTPEDQDYAHEQLGTQNASSDDWRWGWAALSPKHYSDCPLYSLLEKPADRRETPVPVAEAPGADGVGREPLKQDRVTPQGGSSKPTKYTYSKRDKTVWEFITASNESAFETLTNAEITRRHYRRVPPPPGKPSPSEEAFRSSLNRIRKHHPYPSSDSIRKKAVKPKAR